MKGHRGGTAVRICDGCYKIIPKDDKHVQVADPNGDLKDWCGDYRCQVEIQDTPPPTWHCATCVSKGVSPCPHQELHGVNGPDREYGEKFEKATPDSDVIY
jgi:hypothetical protein